MLAKNFCCGVGTLLSVFVFTITFTGDRVVGSGISSKLKSYEVVHAERIHRSIRKRGLENPDPSRYNRLEEINIPAFNQYLSTGHQLLSQSLNLRIYLTPKKGLFHPNFKVFETEGGTEKTKEVFIDPEEFLEGHLYGAPYSQVSIHFDEHNAVTGSIHTSDDTIMLEPAWRHIPHSPLNATLVYKVSDFQLKSKEKKKNDGRESETGGDAPVCGFVQVDENNMVNTSFYEEYDTRFRSKRQTASDSSSPKNRCPVKLIADYRFFRKIGNMQSALAARYLISVIDRVNGIYTSTVWQDSPRGSGLTDQGLLIKEVVVHTKPTTTHKHYNSRITGKWNVVDLLDVFTQQEGSDKFCLVHLFTYQAFAGGVLGLGYIADPKIGTSGGICSSPTRDRGKLKFYNTALSSARSTYGDTVITREADIVTAHEFGHNWGSPHDPQTKECSPSSSQGGAFIMHTYSVQGYDPNNKMFSPCTKRSVKAVLTSKADLCFTENVANFCGNNRVEEGEECDPGVPEEGTGDPCCTRDCRLKQGAVCSPKNAACCMRNCSFSEAGLECLQENSQDCKQASKCNGTSGVCPSPLYMKDGSPCRNDGECLNGHCGSFCEKRSINMKPCMCDKLNETCMRCCRGRSPGSECRPYPPETFLGAGTPCIVGKCNSEGACEEGTQDVIQHLGDIIGKLNINNFSKFLADNLVGTIIILSLIVWIPASLVVNHLDKKKEEERQKSLDWLMGDSLVGDTDRIEVVKDIKTVRL